MGFGRGAVPQPRAGRFGAAAALVTFVVSGGDFVGALYAADAFFGYQAPLMTVLELYVPAAAVVAAVTVLTLALAMRSRRARFAAASGMEYVDPEASVDLETLRQRVWAVPGLKAPEALAVPQLDTYVNAPTRRTREILDQYHAQRASQVASAAQGR